MTGETEGTGAETGAETGRGGGPDPGTSLGTGPGRERGEGHDLFFHLSNIECLQVPLPI